MKTGWGSFKPMLKHVFTNITLKCWTSLPVVGKFLNCLPLSTHTKFLTVLGVQIPSGQQIRESIVLPLDVLHSDLALPVCTTTTEVVTQHCDFLPREKSPQYLQSNSQGQHLHAWMCWGNVVWKYFPWHQPLAPVRQASQAMMLSGLDQNLSGIKDTPL